MNHYLKRANEIKNETIENRRKLHSIAETGFDLPQTATFVKNYLIGLGIEPTITNKNGISCLIGNDGGKTILLRGDMDALPMPEQSALSFSAQNGNCHSCGHDCHTAMLLSAAKLLKEREANIKGYIKLMFQPAEEQLAGAYHMIESGILKNPNVDAAMSIHVAVGTEYSRVGHITYSSGAAMFSGDAVKITVHGKNAHGSTPEAGIDAINIAAHIVIALQEIVSREISCMDNSVIIVGKISGGTTCNTLSGSAELEASIRATTPEKREFLKQRVKEISEATAKMYRGEATVTFVYGIAPMITDIPLSGELASYCNNIVGSDNVSCIPPNCGTEDFTAIATIVPSAYFSLGAGSINEGYSCGLHNPSMILNEDILPIGSAMYAYCAERYLENRSL